LRSWETGARGRNPASNAEARFDVPMDAVLLQPQIILANHTIYDTLAYRFIILLGQGPKVTQTDTIVTVPWVVFDN